MATQVANAAIELVATADAPLTTAVGVTTGAAVGVLVGASVVAAAEEAEIEPSQVTPVALNSVSRAAEKVVEEENAAPVLEAVLAWVAVRPEIS